MWRFPSIPIPANLHKRLAKFLLKRSLGNLLLLQSLDLDSQLDLSSSSSTASLSLNHVHLNLEHLNTQLAAQSLPMVAVEGVLRRVTVTVPWAAIASSSCTVSIDGLDLVLEAAADMSSSVASSAIFEAAGGNAAMAAGLANSTVLAAEFLRRQQQSTSPPPPPSVIQSSEPPTSPGDADFSSGSSGLPGVALLAQLIDALVANLTISVTNVRVTLRPSSEQQRLDTSISSIDTSPDAAAVAPIVLVVPSVTVEPANVTFLETTKPMRIPEVRVLLGNELVAWTTDIVLELATSAPLASTTAPASSGGPSAFGSGIPTAGTIPTSSSSPMSARSPTVPPMGSFAEAFHVRMEIPAVTLALNPARLAALVAWTEVLGLGEDRLAASMSASMPRAPTGASQTVRWSDMRPLSDQFSPSPPPPPPPGVRPSRSEQVTPPPVPGSTRWGSGSRSPSPGSDGGSSESDYDAPDDEVLGSYATGATATQGGGTVFFSAIHASVVVPSTKREGIEAEIGAVEVWIVLDADAIEPVGVETTDASVGEALMLTRQWLDSARRALRISVTNVKVDIAAPPPAETVPQREMLKLSAAHLAADYIATTSDVPTRVLHAPEVAITRSMVQAARRYGAAQQAPLATRIAIPSVIVNWDRPAELQAVLAVITAAISSERAPAPAPPPPPLPLSQPRQAPTVTIPEGLALHVEDMQVQVPLSDTQTVVARLRGIRIEGSSSAAPELMAFAPSAAPAPQPAAAGGGGAKSTDIGSIASMLLSLNEQRIAWTDSPLRIATLAFSDIQVLLSCPKFNVRLTRAQYLALTTLSSPDAGPQPVAAVAALSPAATGSPSSIVTVVRVQAVRLVLVDSESAIDLADVAITTGKRNETYSATIRSGTVAAVGGRGRQALSAVIDCDPLCELPVVSVVGHGAQDHEVAFSGLQVKLASRASMELLDRIGSFLQLPPLPPDAPPPKAITVHMHICDSRILVSPELEAIESGGGSTQEEPSWHASVEIESIELAMRTTSNPGASRSNGTVHLATIQVDYVPVASLEATVFSVQVDPRRATSGSMGSAGIESRVQVMVDHPVMKLGLHPVAAARAAAVVDWIQENLAPLPPAPPAPPVRSTQHDSPPLSATRKPRQATGGPSSPMAAPPLTAAAQPIPTAARAQRTSTMPPPMTSSSTEHSRPTTPSTSSHQDSSGPSVSATGTPAPQPLSHPTSSTTAAAVLAPPKGISLLTSVDPAAFANRQPRPKPYDLGQLSISVVEDFAALDMEMDQHVLVDLDQTSSSSGSGSDLEIASPTSRSAVESYRAHSQRYTTGGGAGAGGAGFDLVEDHFVVASATSNFGAAAGWTRHSMRGSRGAAAAMGYDGGGDDDGDVDDNASDLDDLDDGFLSSTGDEEDDGWEDAEEASSARPAVTTHPTTAAAATHDTGVWSLHLIVSDASMDATLLPAPSAQDGSGGGGPAGPLATAIARGVRAEYTTWSLGLHPHGVLAAVSVAIAGFEVRDLVSTSAWNKLLAAARTRHAPGAAGHLGGAGGPGEAALPFARMEATCFAMPGADPMYPTAAGDDDFEPVGAGTGASAGSGEWRARVRVVPIKMHVDQDTVEGLLEFIAAMDRAVADMADYELVAEPGIASGTSVDSTEYIGSPRSPLTPVLPLNRRTSSSGGDPVRHPTPPSPPIFFQRVEVLPVVIRLDYKPKRVDLPALLERGHMVQLLNVFPLEGAHMTLRHVTVTGVQGWEALGAALLRDWIPHVRNTQLPGMVSGVGPLRSLVNIGSGVADLFLLPVEQYRRDGRVIKGLQRGAHNFVKTAAVETLSLGAKIAVGTHSLLERADRAVNPTAAQPVSSTGAAAGGSPIIMRGAVTAAAATTVSGSSFDPADHHLSPLMHPATTATSKYARQPRDAKEGLSQAIRSLHRNVSAAARVVAVPMQAMERDGATGAVRAVLRAVPVAVLRPMMGATEAVGAALMGIRNDLDPMRRGEVLDKYKDAPVG